MNDLIKALQIFVKYDDPWSPTHCEHDELMVMIDPNVVSEDDKHALNELGFSANEEYNCFSSFRFGSA